MTDGTNLTNEQFTSLLSEIIKKQVVILGPQIAVLKARNIIGLEVAEDGTVTKIEGDPMVLLQKLIDEYVALSGEIVKKAMEPLLSKYPDLKITARVNT